jgi:hypothetical protein
MQETLQRVSSSGMLMPGGNSKIVEVVGLHLMRPSYLRLLRGSLRKLGQVRMALGTECNQDTKPHPSGSELWAINLTKEICTTARI